jgi:hypothetical protein
MEHYNDPVTLEKDVLEGQFLIGKELMVVPVLREDHNHVRGYFPINYE